MSRRLVTIAQAAEHLEVSERTVANYIGRGHFPVYKFANKRGHYVDLKEVEKALASLPTSVARAGHKPFGPNARVIQLGHRVEAVEQ